MRAGRRSTSPSRTSSHCRWFLICLYSLLFLSCCVSSLNKFAQTKDVDEEGSVTFVFQGHEELRPRIIRTAILQGIGCFFPSFRRKSVAWNSHSNSHSHPGAVERHAIPVRSEDALADAFHIFGRESVFLMGDGSLLPEDLSSDLDYVLQPLLESESVVVRFPPFDVVLPSLPSCFFDSPCRTTICG